MNKTLVTFFALSIALLSFSCGSKAEFESYNNLSDMEWYYDSLQTFKIPIKSTDKSYDLNYNIRYSRSYPYYNIYVKYALFDPKGNEVESGVKESILFDSKTGVPKGEGVATFWDFQENILSANKFKEEGEYTLRLGHFMRKEMDTLKNVAAVGVRLIEKK